MPRRSSSKPGPDGCFKGPQIVRVMQAAGMGRPGYVGFATCKGSTKPKRGCEWEIVGVFALHHDAVRMREVMDADEGRAIIRLDYGRLVVVDPLGNLLQDNEAETELLS